MFPLKPPKVPGPQAFTCRRRYFISPYEKDIIDPIINCPKKDCIGYFGSLIYGDKIEFEKGSIIPLDTYEQTFRFLSAVCNNDGYLYPPQEVFIQVNSLTGDSGLIEQPRSWKPADRFSLPPTHQIIIDELRTGEMFRKGIGAFILGIISMLFETRLQFYKWLVDSKVRLKRQPRNVHFWSKDMENILSSALSAWEKWPSKVKIEMINILYLHSKIDTYTGIWERFIAAYLVLDGCFSVCENLLRVPLNIHQFCTLCLTKDNS